MIQAMRQIYETYHLDVYRYLYSLCRNQSLAEDLTSETFLAAICGIARFRGDAEMKTWLFAIAQKRWLRHPKRNPHTELPQETIEERESSITDPATAVVRAAMAHRAAELLQLEAPRTQKIVKLRLEGYSFQEIGEQAGIAANTARVIDFRAKEKIRRQLQKEGYENER